MLRPLTKTYVLIVSAFILTTYLVLLQYRLMINNDYLGITRRPLTNIEKNEHLEEAFARITFETIEYDWKVSGVNKIEDLVLHKGGKPHRTLFAAPWRAGSTFLEYLFSVLPGSFYYYEPLRYLNSTQVRGPPLATHALEVIKSVFQCKRYDVVFDFIKEKERGYTRHFNREFRRVWEYTGEDLQLMLDPVYMHRLCRMFPFQSVKESIVRLEILNELMKDKNLGLRMVYLVRDPRAIIQSRREDPICNENAECIRPEYVCADMINDYYAAATLLRDYPERFRVIRLEELALHSYETIEELLKFLKIDMIKPVRMFLKSHTDENDSTYKMSRDSKDTIFKWKQQLDFKVVNEIQIACSGAMKLWGYLPAYNGTHLKSEAFDSLDNYTIRLRNQTF